MMWCLALGVAERAGCGVGGEEVAGQACVCDGGSQQDHLKESLPGGGEIWSCCVCIYIYIAYQLRLTLRRAASSASTSSFHSMYTFPSGPSLLSGGVSVIRPSLMALTSLVTFEREMRGVCVCVCAHLQVDVEGGEKAFAKASEAHLHHLPSAGDKAPFRFGRCGAKWILACGGDKLVMVVV